MKTVLSLILVLSASGVTADELAFRVNVHTNGQYSTARESVTKDQLSKYLQDWHQEFGAFTFLIQPDQGVTFSNVWSVIEIASRTGLCRQCIIIEGRRITVSVPARDLGPPGGTGGN